MSPPVGRSARALSQADPGREREALGPSAAYPRDVREGGALVGGCDLPASGRWDADPDEHCGTEVGSGIRSGSRRGEATESVELSPRDAAGRLRLVVDVEVSAPPERLLPEAVGPARKVEPDLAAVAQHRPEAPSPVPLRVVVGRRPRRRVVFGERDERMRRLRQMTG